MESVTKASDDMTAINLVKFNNMDLSACKIALDPSSHDIILLSLYSKQKCLKHKSTADIKSLHTRVKMAGFCDVKKKS